jgi:hypothetical protein
MVFSMDCIFATVYLWIQASRSESKRIQYHQFFTFSQRRKIPKRKGWIHASAIIHIVVLFVVTLRWSSSLLIPAVLTSGKVTSTNVSYLSLQNFAPLNRLSLTFRCCYILLSKFCLFEAPYN